MEIIVVGLKVPLLMHKLKEYFCFELAAHQPVPPVINEDQEPYISRFLLRKELF